MFVQWILDHMGEYGMASLTCTSYEAGRDTLFDDGTQARRWHVGNDGRTGAYTTEDLTAVPLDGDGSFDGPEVETLLEPGTLVLTNPPFSLATRFMRMIGRHPDVDYLIVANQFQSTLPGWGATAKMDIFAHDMGKIIHFQH